MPLVSESVSPVSASGPVAADHGPLAPDRCSPRNHNR